MGGWCLLRHAVMGNGDMKTWGMVLIEPHMGNGAYCDMQTWGMVLIETCRHGEWCLL